MRRSDICLHGALLTEPCDDCGIVEPSKMKGEIVSEDKDKAPERIWLPADTDADTWNVLAKNPSHDWRTGEPANNIEYVRARDGGVARVDNNAVTNERKQLREAARFAAVQGPYSSALFEATCAGARVNFRDLATPAAVIRLLDEVEQVSGLRKALEEMAQQRLRCEIEPIDGEITGDFEGAYDIMINVAREALAATAPITAPVEEEESERGVK